MKIYQSGSFEKKTKRMHKREKEILDQEIRNISNTPSIGDEKKGDLKGIFVHKFKIKTIEYLLAYRMAGKDSELIMIGPHENYYRALKRYVLCEEPMKGLATASP
jgi:mRNA-degrading endonuclease RelE of RelBE toxin-antitoxin system